MQDDETFPCSDRLLENYERCLRWRLELWFPEFTLRRDGAMLEARRGALLATMIFHPALCQWELQSPEPLAKGSFDRVSKRLRQLFSFGE